MKQLFKKGDKKLYTKVVENDDIARFESGIVHHVCSTFSLAQAIEWSTRLFVLDMKEEDEEGIGTNISIEHKSPALVGEEVRIEAFLEEINDNEIICSYTAKVDDRIIAEGRTGQKIVKKEKLNKLFDSIKNG